MEPKKNPNWKKTLEAAETLMDTYESENEVDEDLLHDIAYEVLKAVYGSDVLDYLYGDPDDSDDDGDYDDDDYEDDEDEDEDEDD